MDQKEPIMFSIRRAALVKMKELRQLFDSPEAWTKRTYARDKNGRAISSLDPQACQFCLDGGIRFVCKGPSPGPAADPVYATSELIRTTITNATGGVWIHNFNDADKTTHADIIRVLDASVVALEKLVAEQTLPPAEPLLPATTPTPA